MPNHNPCIIFRALGLNLVNALFSTPDSSEPKKVAINKSRLVALIRLAAHAAPLSAAIILLALNSSDILVQNSEWLSSLQFVAKLHEVLMHSSITCVAIAYIRQKFVFEKIPLGALFVGLQIANLASLWSIEFIGALAASWVPVKDRLKFGFLIVGCVVLAAAVGPASAILMIPRTSTIRVAIQDVDLHLNNAMRMSLSVENRAYPANDLVWKHDEFNNKSFLDVVEPSALAVEVAAAWDTGPTNDTAQKIVAHTAVPLKILSTVTSLATHRSESRQMRFSGPIALAAASCSPPKISSNNDGLEQVQFSLPDGRQINTDIDHLRIQELVRRNGSVGFLFEESPSQYHDTVSALFLWAVRGMDLTESLRPFDGVSYYPCVIKASWPEAMVNVSSGSTLSIKWHFKDHVIDKSINSNSTQTWKKTRPFGWSEKAVHIKPDWISHIALSIDKGRNTSPSAVNALAQMFTVQFQGLLALKDDSIRNSTGRLLGSYLLQDLTAIIATSMSSLSCDFTSGCPQGAPLDFPNATSSENDIVRVEVYVTGRAYSLCTWPARLAAAIITIYCILALLHCIASLITGTSSNSWDTSGEQVALALVSDPPTHLGDTSAGLTRLQTFSERVGVRKNPNGGLKMSFFAESDMVEEKSALLECDEYY